MSFHIEFDDQKQVVIITLPVEGAKVSAKSPVLASDHASKTGDAKTRSKSNRTEDERELAFTEEKPKSKKRRAIASMESNSEDLDYEFDESDLDN